MKVLLEIRDTDLDEMQRQHNCENVVELYEKIWKGEKWKYRTDYKTIYRIASIPFMPQIGQTLGVDYVDWIVVESCFDIDQIEINEINDHHRVVITPKTSKHRNILNL